MPRRLSIKTVVVEAVLFVGLFTLVGHLTLNFWERFVIQSELTNMKTSLHSLKDTINGIGNAYDDLQKELRVIAKVEMKPAIVSVNQRQLHCCRNKFKLDRQPHQDRQIQTLMKLNKTHNFKWSESAGKNATTITKYPPKATGVGSDIINNEHQCHFVTCRHNVERNDFGHDSCKDYEYCRHTCENWNHNIGVH